MGLSSSSTRLSTPTLSSRASERRFSDLVPQLILHAEKCSRRSSMSGCWSRVVRTSFSVFLLHKQSSIPLARCASANSCRARRGASMTTPSGPSSPTTPFHSVWSPSSTRTLGGAALVARSLRTISVPSAAKNAGGTGRGRAPGPRCRRRRRSDRSRSAPPRLTTCTPRRAASLPATLASASRTAAVLMFRRALEGGQKTTSSGDRRRSAADAACRQEILSRLLEIVGLRRRRPDPSPPAGSPRR